MKRFKHLFEEVCSFENLLLAERKARRGKRFQSSGASFHHRLEEELLQIQDDLQTKTYQPGPFRTFAINDPKRRWISAAPFRDRVVHHALCNVIEPIFDRSFIHDSYACRTGKGTHAAVDRLTRFMRNADYVLKCDIRKYFPSIDHAILKEHLRRKIGCSDTLWLIDLIIDHGGSPEEVIDYFPGDDLFTPHDRRRGLPLGNQTSQFFANVYLDPFDHFIKEELGCRYYVRYVDDFAVLGEDKEILWSVLDDMEAFLAHRLRLRIHPKKRGIIPVHCGIDFLGYRVHPTHRRLRRSSGLRFARKLKTLQRLYRVGEIDLKPIHQKVAGWVGHACHADTYGLRTAILGSAVFQRASVPETRPAGRLVEQQ